jgi:pimeloyl-ACP methyl ester carboxylesterase
MPILEHGSVTIYYEEHGTKDGFPLMLLPPGGMDATVDRWKRIGFVPIESFGEYRVVVLDQRNAGHSRGPLDFDDPWGGYANDQLRLADYLSFDRFHVVGQCIGSSYALTLAKRVPDRIASAVLVQPIGLEDSNRAHWPDLKHFLASHFYEVWAQELLRKRPELDSATVEKFAPGMFSGDFVFSVSREDVRRCTTPLLVLPGIDPVHPGTIGREVAKFAQNAEMMEEWKGPELIPKTIERVNGFLKAHTPT